MQVSDRWQQASLYGLITTVIIGVVALLATVGPVMRPGYFRTAVLSFVVTCAILAALTIAWYWMLRLLGK